MRGSQRSKEGRRQGGKEAGKERDTNSITYLQRRLKQDCGHGALNGVNGRQWLLHVRKMEII